MVVFTCDSCNEALKKNKVLGHNCYATFTCVDCFVTFTRNTYNTHNKCVTEAQRYGGANYVAKDNKGEVKQLQWTDRIAAAAQYATSLEKGRLQKLAGCENVPRKQKPFINFCKNAMNIRRDDDAKKLWDVLQECLAKAEASSKEEAPNSADKREGNGETSGEKTSKESEHEENSEEKSVKKKKEKRDAEEVEEEPVKEHKKKHRHRNEEAEPIVEEEERHKKSKKRDRDEESHEERSHKKRRRHDHDEDVIDEEAERRERKRRRREQREREAEEEAAREQEREERRARRKHKEREREEPKSQPFKFSNNAQSTESNSGDVAAKDWATRIAAVAPNDAKRSKFEKLLGLHKAGSGPASIDQGEVQALKQSYKDMKDNMDKHYEQGRVFTHRAKGHGL